MKGWVLEYLLLLFHQLLSIQTPPSTDSHHISAHTVIQAPTLKNSLQDIVTDARFRQVFDLARSKPLPPTLLPYMRLAAATSNQQVQQVGGLRMHWHVAGLKLGWAVLRWAKALLL